MLNFYEILLVKRFLFSKKTDGYISVFSWFSVIGITIGVAAIIIVMSVMNGFREEFTSRLLGINGHLNIYSQNGEIEKKDFELLYNELNQDIIAYPIIQTQALIVTDNSSQGVFLRGYDESFINKDHFLRTNIIQGNVFKKNSDSIVIGKVLAKNLSLKIGDKIKIAIPKTDKTIFGNIPRFKTLIISGIFNLGMYEFDSSFIYTDSSIAKKLLLIDENYTSIEIFTNNPEKIEVVQKNINDLIRKNNLDFYSYSWKQNNSALINALNVEKNVMFLILTLIIIVASMNIISGLIIFVKEKNKDIAILKTIGINNLSLIKIFLAIGFFIGISGTFFGGLIGLIFSKNIEFIQNFLENILDTELFAQEVYYLSNLPAKINAQEVVFVLVIAILISLIATVFPAYRSSKVDPIKSLKND